MSVFIEPPFWYTPGRSTPAVRWSALLVTPAVPIVSSSVASPTVITTSVPHGLASGDTVQIAGHTGSTPAVDGSRVVTVLSPTTFTVPVAVTVAGTGGTVTRTLAAPIIPLAEAKLHARMNASVTTEDSAVESWTQAAQQQVENDTGVKLSTNTFDLVADRLPGAGEWIELPFGPLQSVVSLQTYDSATPSVLQTMAAGDYLADVISVPGRIGLATSKVWPTDLRAFQPVTLRVVAGYAAIASIPAPLLQAVRKAIAWHAMHREPTSLERGDYDWLIGPFQRPLVA